MAKYDILDIELLVANAFAAFCEFHNITTRAAKQKALAEIADVAKQLKGRQ